MFYIVLRSYIICGYIHFNSSNLIGNWSLCADSKRLNKQQGCIHQNLYFLRKCNMNKYQKKNIMKVSIYVLC